MAQSRLYVIPSCANKGLHAPERLIRHACSVDLGDLHPIKIAPTESTRLSIGAFQGRQKETSERQLVNNAPPST